MGVDWESILGTSGAGLHDAYEDAVAESESYEDRRSDPVRPHPWARALVERETAQATSVPLWSSASQASTSESK